MKKSKFIETLIKESEDMKKMIHAARDRLSDAPEGSVRVLKHRDGYQFFHRTNPADRSGVYIPVSEKEKAIALMQKKYDLKIKEVAEQQVSAIDRFLQRYDPDILKKIYSSLSDVRKQYVVPVEITNQEYARRWTSKEYKPKSFTEDAPEHYTSCGERVRSKSEVMIADALKQAGVPYRYECPLTLGSTLIHPDFTILRMEDREEIYWEHLGMMDDPDYVHKAIQRIRMYESCGVCPGVNLILSMETSRIPINRAVINKLITTYCK